ncbi:MAG TPA: zf-HC2 domain-containing protein [Pyrinomonadaceae bacterium]|nr:zf-HC2 domain-containing protein [Pyrinomonadaceae bacterium]
MNTLDSQRRACELTRAELDTYMDGELGVAARERVLEHLEFCGPCGEELGARRCLRRLLQRAAGREAAPPALAARVRHLVRGG